MVPKTTTAEFQIEEFETLNELQIPAEQPEESNAEKKAIEEYENMINQHFLKRKDIFWINIFIYLILHLVTLYGFITFPYREKKLTFMWGLFLIIVANFGVAGGVHRLWAHRAYKARLPLRIILILCYLVSGQYSALNWITDHRIHHKFSDTNADPVNASRGFWFSHIGWLTMERHPAYLQKLKVIDLSDVLADPVLKFSEKYFKILSYTYGIFLPAIVPVYFWRESWYWAILSQVFMRYAVSLNCTWGINSFAHIFGSRPYDKRIAPAENIIMSFVTGGEGWHNYHHTFPVDYKCAEFGGYLTDLNLTSFLIDAFAKIGWAYDLKQPSNELVQSVLQKHGDGSHSSKKSEMKIK